MIKKRKAWLFILIGVFLITACNLPAPKAPAANGPDLAATITAQARILQSSSMPASATADFPAIITAQAAQLKASPGSTQPGSTSTATASVTATLSATPTSTSTPAGASVTVSQDTNCRTGPGQVYPGLYVLTAGASAQVIGKSSLTGYWIIPVPGSAGTICWLYPYFATVSGNTSGLREYSIPPTPTPLVTNTPTRMPAPAAPSKLTVQNVVCAPTDVEYVFAITGVLSWKDNSSDENGFRIYTNVDFTDGSSPDQQAATVGANVNSSPFQFNSLSGGTFSVKVQAFNDGGSSPLVEIKVTPVCQ